MLAEALDVANGKFLEQDKSPSRKVGELDVRGQPFLPGAVLGAGAGRAGHADAELKTKFGTVAVALEQKEATIVAELNGAQGKPVDIGGYYHPSPDACAKAMRPSGTFNKVIDRI